MKFQQNLLIKTTRSDPNSAGHSRKKRGEFPSSNTYSQTSDISVKHKKRYLDYLEGNLKPTCIIHGPVNLSHESKALGDFGSKYSKCRPTKDCGNNNVQRGKFKRQQENNIIVNSAVDEILLHENQKLSAEKGEHENIESDFEESKLYQIDNMSLEDTKGNIE